jgi:hypothetical protein
MSSRPSAAHLCRIDGRQCRPHVLHRERMSDRGPYARNTWSSSNSFAMRDAAPPPLARRDRSCRHRRHKPTGRSTRACRIARHEPVVIARIEPHAYPRPFRLFRLRCRGRRSRRRRPCRSGKIVGEVALAGCRPRECRRPVGGDGAPEVGPGELTAEGWRAAHRNVA